jgi:hypothetical protein
VFIVDLLCDGSNAVGDFMWILSLRFDLETALAFARTDLTSGVVDLLGLLDVSALVSAFVLATGVSAAFLGIARRYRVTFSSADIVFSSPASSGSSCLHFHGPLATGHGDHQIFTSPLTDFDLRRPTILVSSSGQPCL